MTNYYDQEAEKLFDQYEGIDSKVLHGFWREHLPDRRRVALDVGSGTGRDAAYLAGLFDEVVAVEPARGLRELAEQHHSSPKITWIDDRLPALASIREREFDLILLNAVWMHVAPTDRGIAVASLNERLRSGGMLVMIVREQSDAERGMFPTSGDEEARLFRDQGFSVRLRLSGQADIMGREDVTWRYWVVEKQG